MNQLINSILDISHSLNQSIPKLATRIPQSTTKQNKNLQGKGRNRMFLKLSSVGTWTGLSIFSIYLSIVYVVLYCTCTDIADELDGVSWGIEVK